MNNAAQAELTGYLNLLFITIKTKSIDYFSIAVNSFLQNTLLFAIIGMVSLAMAGIPIIIIMVLLKGFFVGFTVGVLAFNIGAGGFLAIVICTFLPNIVLIPCILRGSVQGLNYTMTVVKSRRIPKTTRDRLIASKPHMAKMFKIYLLSLIGVCIETFLTPMLIKLM
jgi:stage II sporulation protein M